jgi:hypothetical protein
MEEVREALSQVFLFMDDFPADEKGMFADVHLELRPDVEMGPEFGIQVIDKSRDGRMMGGEKLHGRHGMGQEMEDLPRELD